jgi:hypothetical protein
MAIGDDLSARPRAIPAPLQGALIMTAAVIAAAANYIAHREARVAKQGAGAAASESARSRP